MYFLTEAQVRTYTTARLDGDAPDIDGRIDEAVWESVEWSGDFTQKEPYEYAEPSQKTAFKILYDDNNLYVAIRAFDTEPDKIEHRLGRRDKGEGDWVAIGISSIHDKLSAFGFSVNAVGVKGDGVVNNDTEWDDTPQPVWYVKTSIDALGWVAEMRIPFNQLRFAKKENHVWGLEVMRTLFRKEEFSVWQMVPQDADAWVSRWGELHGINNIKPKKEIALTPYLMGGVETSEKEEGNPFQTGTDWQYNAGLDGKIAVTNDLTLNFTINPDFGQVEADPSQVNLSAFELYFKEQRPFFVEGSNIFNYQLSAGSGFGSRDNLFYSRRIGRRPQYYPELSTDEYANVPDYTRILGAFKLSGKTRNGWSIGVLESVTNQEYASIDKNGERRKEPVEPLTSFFNARLQKDINKGKTIVGGMFTATNRFISDSTLEFLPTAAYTGGLDFEQFWDSRTWNLKAKAVFSSVSGSKEALLRLQEAPRRFYQRPDASHRTVDSSLTLMQGTDASFRAAKIGRGHWRFGLKGGWISPGLAINDIGFLIRADAIDQSAWVSYVIWNPFSIFRKMDMGISQWSGWDFGGQHLFSGIRARWSTQFKNYWSVRSWGSRGAFDIDRHQLRGGPAIRKPGIWRTGGRIETDNRKKLVGNLFISRAWGDVSYRQAFDIGFGITYQPLPSLQLSVSPTYVHDQETAFYVSTGVFEGENKYIVANLDRISLVMNLRINYSITPDLSVQFWGQPYFFSGDYWNYKEVNNAGSTDYYKQFHVFDENEISFNEADNEYLIDENKDGTTDYSFGNPDFSFYEFRSNFVIRWEYVPGSTVFFVWSQGRTGSTPDGRFSLNENMNKLFDETPRNIFLLKFSYRFSF
ncbi:MAG: carbohydrate binding family 9 domain-containing protein [Bacteroidales bacterium]|nr:carbohydrate binding family 9 domain-containing protein [Bacteroidales bacterium]